VNYIIDPAVFYWINVFSILQTALAMFGVFMVIGGIVFAVVWKIVSGETNKPVEPKWDENNTFHSEYELKVYTEKLHEYENAMRSLSIYRKWMKPLFIIGIAMIVISIFVPSKQTSIEMLVARTATFENVDWTVSQVKEIVDYIVNAIKGAV